MKVITFNLIKMLTLPKKALIFIKFRILISAKIKKIFVVKIVIVAISLSLEIENR